jgi:cytochrome c biogenesis protein
MTSIGIIKVPDNQPEQIGIVAFFYPTAAELSTGAYTSIFPGIVNPLISMNVYTGDLGLDSGQSLNVYALDTGCVWGRELTMMRLEDHKLFSV